MRSCFPFPNFSFELAQKKWKWAGLFSLGRLTHNEMVVLFNLARSIFSVSPVTMTQETVWSSKLHLSTTHSRVTTASNRVQSKRTVLLRSLAIGYMDSSFSKPYLSSDRYSLSLSLSLSLSFALYLDCGFVVFVLYKTKFFVWFPRKPRKEKLNYSSCKILEMMIGIVTGVFYTMLNFIFFFFHLGCL